METIELWSDEYLSPKEKDESRKLGKEMELDAPRRDNSGSASRTLLTKSRKRTLGREQC